MAGRNRLTGICWHEEWHTVNPKKEKAADCIYLTKDRLCRNRDCIINGEKCFVATHCKHRIKTGNAPKPVPAVPEQRCSLPQKAIVFSRTYGVGEYIGYDKCNHLITINFDSCTKMYKYPDAFLERHLVGNEIVDLCVTNDSKNHS